MHYKYWNAQRQWAEQMALCVDKPDGHEAVREFGVLTERLNVARSRFHDKLESLYAAYYDGLSHADKERIGIEQSLDDGDCEYLAELIDTKKEEVNTGRGRQSGLTKVIAGLTKENTALKAEVAALKR